MSLIFTILLWIHIAAAASWLGPSVFMKFVVGPVLGQISNQGRYEFYAKYHRISRPYFLIIKLSTMVSGGLLLYLLSGGAFITLTSRWGMWIVSGALLAVFIFVLLEITLVPIYRRTKESYELQQKGSKSELDVVGPLERRIAWVGRIQLVTLLVILLTMIAARNL